MKNLLAYIHNPVDMDTDWYERIVDELKKESIELCDSQEFLNHSTSKISIFVVPAEIILFPEEDKVEKYITDISFIVRYGVASLIIFTEMYEHNFDLLEILNGMNSRIIIFSPCIVNTDRRFPNLKFVFFPLWLNKAARTVYQSAEVRNAIHQLKLYNIKPMIAEILLGTYTNSKPHRDFIFEMVNNSVLKDKVIMNFRSYKHTNSNSDFFLDEDGIEHLPYDENSNFKFHSTRPIKVYGYKNTVANVLPIKIWNQTAYSVVAETSVSNYISLMSEKTFKPMLGRKLFIMFAGQYHLKNLRSLGFKTFDGIIDETYDTIENPYVRWAMAFNQLLWLSAQYQTVIFERINPIVEHNFQLMLDLNWRVKESKLGLEELLKISG
jgi:hypothetical protein